VIIADTNVLSEPLRPRPDPQVLTWLARHAGELAVTAITIGELAYGVARLPPGSRRDRLGDAVDALVATAGPRLIPYDASASRAYASLRARREAAGHPLSIEDGMIAGICLAGGHDLATRSVRDFADAGIRLHDPWAPAQSS